MTREEMNEEKQKEISKENQKEQTKKIVKKVVKTIILVTILTTLFFLYNQYVSTSIIKVREYRIINDKIPTSFNGIKIIQFSDLHYGSTMFQENLKQIKKQINIRKPDIILFTGDLIDKDYNISKEEKEKLTKELKELNATLGKYAILGDEDKEEVTTIFNQSDFITLKNEYDFIYNKKQEPILLIGISSLIKEEQDIEKSFSYFKEESHNKDIYTITMIHEPDTYLEIKDTYNPDLVLAGHSHNGNIRIPFINYPLERSNGSMKYINEEYEIGNTKMYISSGLGTNNLLKVRLFCRPSINFYRLSSE